MPKYCPISNKIKLGFLIFSLLIIIYPTIYLSTFLVFQSNCNKLITNMGIINISLALINIIFPNLQNYLFLIFTKFLISGLFSNIILFYIENYSIGKIKNNLSLILFNDGKTIDLTYIYLIKIPRVKTLRSSRDRPYKQWRIRLIKKYSKAYE